VNLYQYVLSSPTNTTDSEGLFFPLLAGIVAAGTAVTDWAAGTYANLKSAAILSESASWANQTAGKVQTVLQECAINPSSHLGCSDTNLLNELQKNNTDLYQATNKMTQKAACYLGTSVPGTSISGDVPASIYDLVGGSLLGLVLPDPCQ
jgi:hypothetical protein